MGILDWAYSQGKRGIEKQIHKAIEKKRLVLLNGNHVLYISKEGERTTCSFKQVVGIFKDVGGWGEQMIKLGITDNDVEDILQEEYKKHKQEAK